MFEDKDSIVQGLSYAVKGAGCQIEKFGEVRPSNTGGYVHIHNADTIKFRIKQVEFLGSFFRTNWLKMLNTTIESESIQDLMGITNSQLELAHSTNPSSVDWVKYFGIDLIGPNKLICDLNTDRATIVGFQQEIAEIFENYYNDKDIYFPKFYDQLIPYINSQGKFKPNRIFVLTYPNEQYGASVRNFANRFGFKVGSISEFNPRQIDLVIRQVKAEEILNHPTLYYKLLNSLKKGLPMINPLGSYLTGHKGWVTTLPAIYPELKSWFPKTWLINNGKALSSEGKISMFNDLLDLFSDAKNINNRKKFVLKKEFGAGGWQVFIGADLKNYQWKELLSQVRDSKHAWVIEEKVLRKDAAVRVGTWEKDDLKITTENLNIIERIYSVSGQVGYCGEAFGKNSNKVNASGYTFPLAFANL